MKKENMDNKGFSLVELIIVIAIMAILIVVLAPQYLKYVEKSRVSSDQTTIVEYINAMQVIAADPDITLDATTKTYTLTSAANSDTITVSSDLATLIEGQGMLDATAAAGGKWQSTAYKTAAMDIQLVYDTGKKVWNVKKVSGTVDVSGKLPTT
ncbi:MAG: prepilin-type N-terminal cleavage/methylation domain-containing protein [Bacteroidales bacterium]|nr:prepilin-type N-terminal cleavage/methylation domain-containing protein [Bacteroidales bacterium]MCM1415120.1 prepilin-type N-terminal cleavage/methylation domain-containing protein [bacterium]MCM1423800.1 prepilin-type N-terminal cleavage/methylation domain-containing protein [bacterium]